MPKSDEMPMMEHEVGGISEEIHDGGVYVKQTRRQTAFRLAIITLLVFTCAMAFLSLFLITPVFYSLSFPVKHESTNQSNDTMANMPSMSHGDHDDHGSHGHENAMGNDDHGGHTHHKRSVNQIEDELLTYIKRVCPCAKSLDVLSAEFKECIRGCASRYGSSGLSGFGGNL